MSENRRLKRASQRQYGKVRRKLDWGKIITSFKYVPFIWLVGFLFIFSVSYDVVNRQNFIRTTVSNNRQTTSAKIINISTGKGAHIATYEFTTNGIKYSGTTFHSYKGVVGDSICVQYSTLKPEMNLFCNDEAMETIYDDVILYSLKILGIMVGMTIAAFILTVFWRFLNADKKTITTFTSKSYGR
jgi:hypothetical protein